MYPKETLQFIQDQIIDTGEELAKALKYMKYIEGSHPQYTGSLGFYIPEDGKESGNDFIVLTKRGIMSRGNGWIFDLFSDSLYAGWFVFTRGDIGGLFDKIEHLLESNEGLWPEVAEAWAENMSLRRTSLVNPLKHTEQGRIRTPTSQKEEGPDRESDLYTAPTSVKTPTFGALPLKERRTSAKPVGQSMSLFPT